MKYSKWVVAAFGVCAGGGLLAQAQEMTAAVGAEYTTGDYGGGADTDVFYVPFSAGLETDDWSVQLSVPWLNLSGPGVFLGENIPLVRDGRAPVRGAGEDVSGLGDVSLIATRTFDLDAQSDWQVDLTGRVKFATADETNGLSTGEMDYSAAIDVTRNFDAWSIFAGGGYRITGDPAGQPLDDTAFASLGASYYTESGTNWGAALDFTQAATAGTDDALEASGWVSVSLSEKARLQIYGLAGLTDGGPDMGAGMRLAFRL